MALWLFDSSGLRTSGVAHQASAAVAAAQAPIVENRELPAAQPWTTPAQHLRVHEHVVYAASHFTTPRKAPLLLPATSCTGACPALPTESVPETPPPDPLEPDATMTGAEEAFGVAAALSHTIVGAVQWRFALTAPTLLFRMASAEQGLDSTHPTLHHPPPPRCHRSRGPTSIALCCSEHS